MSQPPKLPPKGPPRGGPMSPPPLRAAAPGRAPAPAGLPQPRTQTQPQPVRGATNSASPPLPGSPQGVARSGRVAAAGATGTVSAVMEAVKLVDEILLEENQVLRRHDTKAAAALQDRKMAATRLYQERMRALIRDTEAARAMTQDQRLQLSQMAHGLDQRVKENAILLKAAMDAIDRLFGAINQAAQKKVQKEVAYSRGAVVAPSAAPTAASIAFNRMV